MPLTMGGIFPRQHESAKIRNNQRVHPGVVQPLQIGGQLGDFLVSRHGVHSHMAFNAMRVGKFYRVRQFLWGKISREGAHTEAGTRQIYRVRTVEDGHFEPFHISGGAKKFQFSHWPSA